MLDRTAAAPTAIEEARRQTEICNACRYCEGYCAVFPAMFRNRTFSDGDLTQLANLCHNCRGCYYACQYTAPHEFDLNVPAALAEVRAESAERFAWPAPVSRLFHRSGVALSIAIAVGVAVLFAAIGALRPAAGEGFYAVLSHAAMVAIFTPLFVLPLLVVAVGLVRYWRSVGGTAVRGSDLWQAGVSAGRLKNLSGGPADGCNYEAGDRFTNARRHAHQATMFGFLLCFASTTSGTVMHYILDWPAPYPIYSLPKLLGVPGGILLTLGAGALAVLKLKADRALGARANWGGEMAFVILLGLTGATGLLLYAATGTTLVAPLLAIHLGLVAALFVTTPYSKMSHGFFRFAALVREAQEARKAARA